VEIGAKNSWVGGSGSQLFGGFILGNQSGPGIPPPPCPLKCRDWRGVCKNALQNLEPLGVRGQNLENKGVGGVLTHGARTAFALASFCFFNFGRKVRCHMGLWNLLGVGQRARMPVYKRRKWCRPYGTGSIGSTSPRPYSLG